MLIVCVCSLNSMNVRVILFCMYTFVCGGDDPSAVGVIKNPGAAGDGSSYHGAL